MKAARPERMRSSIGRSAAWKGQQHEISQHRRHRSAGWMLPPAPSYRMADGRQGQWEVIYLNPTGRLLGALAVATASRSATPACAAQSRQLWSGTASRGWTCIPSGWLARAPRDVEGGLQVALPTMVPHTRRPMYGTASSWVDLHPLGGAFDRRRSGRRSSGGLYHPGWRLARLLWNRGQRLGVWWICTDWAMMGSLTGGWDSGGHVVDSSAFFHAACGAAARLVRGLTPQSRGWIVGRSDRGGSRWWPCHVMAGSRALWTSGGGGCGWICTREWDLLDLVGSPSGGRSRWAMSVPQLLRAAVEAAAPSMGLHVFLPSNSKVQGVGIWHDADYLCGSVMAQHEAPA